MKMNAVFQCKSPSLGDTPCEIRKVLLRSPTERTATLRII